MTYVIELGAGQQIDPEKFYDEEIESQLPFPFFHDYIRRKANGQTPNQIQKRGRRE